MYENESLIEVAIELVKSKKHPHTILEIAREVFEIKGMKISENKELYSQFEADFMMCGYFACCGEEKNKKGVKVKLWDLKDQLTQPLEIINKDNIYLEDPHDEDDEVKKNELTDEDYIEDKEYPEDYTVNEEEEEEDETEEETDDIEEALSMSEDYEESEIKDLDDDDVEEDSYDDDDENN